MRSARQRFWIIALIFIQPYSCTISADIKIPMVDIAVGLALGEKFTDMGYGTGVLQNRGLWGVKVPVFSNDKLPGIDPKLGAKDDVNRREPRHGNESCRCYR